MPTTTLARATRRTPVGARQRLGVAAAAAATLLALAVVASLAIGANPLPLAEVLRAFTAYDPANPAHDIVRDLRVDRTIVGVVAGAALAVAGGLAQALTRNPLADPGLLGLNAGAALAIVLGAMTGVAVGYLPQVGLAVLGAAVAGAVVYAVGGSRSGSAAPVRLALAGAAVTALLTAATSAIVLANPTVLAVFRYWLAGSLIARSDGPILAFATAVALLFVAVAAHVRALAAVSLGDDAASGLGVNIRATRLRVMALVVLLSAVATALAGPIAFVGLAVPHLVRAIAGPRIGWLLGLCAPVGAAVTLAADVLGRVVARPGELSVGIATALAGGIVLAVLARRLQVVGL